MPAHAALLVAQSMVQRELGHHFDGMAAWPWGHDIFQNDLES